VDPAVEARVAEIVSAEEADVCGEGASWTFCIGRARSSITENEFVRRYKRVTGQGDLNRFLRPRNPGSLIAWSVLAAGGLGLMIYGLVALYDPCPMGMPMCSPPTNRTSQTLALVGGLGAAAAGGMLVFALVRGDGKPTEHLISEYEARIFVGRYNAALAERVRRELSGQALFAPAPVRVGVRPLFGPTGVGLVVTF
jgi:hypothetical protein